MRRGTEFVLGWSIGGNGTAITLQANSGNAVAQAFIAPGGGVRTVRVPITAIAGGGVPAGYLRCRIVASDSDDNFLPDMYTILATANSQNNANSANTFVNFSSFSSHTLTPGTRYYLVIDNMHSTGTVTVQPADYPAQSGSPYAHALAVSLFGGWSYNGTNRRIGEQIEFSNGDVVHCGLITSGIPDALYVYGSRMHGFHVTLGSVGLRVVGVCWYGQRLGVGCTIVTRVLDMSDNVLATSHSVFGDQLSQPMLRAWYFSSPVELQPNSSYRIVLANPNGDGNSSNCYRLSVRVRAYDSSTVAMLHGGIFQSLRSCDYNGSWSDDTNNNLPRAFLLVLDSDQPFISGGSSGGSSDGIVPALNRGVW